MSHDCYGSRKSLHLRITRLAIRGLVIASLFALSAAALAAEPTIDVWYGDSQHFGLRGHPQKWVNVLGSVSPADTIASLQFSLNDAQPESLSFRENRKRIAHDGDFNIEISRSTLHAGINTVVIVATDDSGAVKRKVVELHYHDAEKQWPLPYHVDWSSVSNIQDVVQIVDGKWRLTASGVRTVEPYYDRVIAFGDSSWSDYEVTTTLTVHGVTAPKTGPNDTGVTHAAIALRWPGHDADGQQPSVKWYPLGATAEFRLGGDLQNCRWRIFDGKREYYVESDKRRAIEFEKPYRMKHRVETISDGNTRYRVKFWPAHADEPAEWDLQRIEPDDLASGSALLIAHHSDVTFGNIAVRSIDR